MSLQAVTQVRKLKIVIVSAFYSEGMGYSENCLSKALAKLGHDVHVVTSTYNVYGTEPLYNATYREFLGPAKTTVGTRVIDGYTVHRLDAGLLFGYVNIRGLNAKVRELAPDIVHSLEVASLQTYKLAGLQPLARFNLFTETHQTLSVMRPYMRHKNGKRLKRAGYRLTRTLPSFLASLTIETCYAVTPDCYEVARRFYGVPASKLKLVSLGADTDMFHPAETDEEHESRAGLRGRFGYSEDDIVCVYTGRFTQDKNPLALAQAIDALARTDPRYKGLFVGDGDQKSDIAACRNTTIVPFMTHAGLAQHYRAADIGVWPRQESMSMIDAAASGVPIVVSNRIGERGRVAGNGKMYEENDVRDLIAVIRSFASAEERRAYGAVGRRKALDGFSWNSVAQTMEADFVASL
jgi:glycosyltransferase involved in cell wall biosynthesis